MTKNDSRGICELLRLSPALREMIGLHKVPHWTTLSILSSRKAETLIAEASMKVLAYAIRRGELRA